MPHRVLRKTLEVARIAAEMTGFNPQCTRTRPQWSRIVLQRTRTRPQSNGTRVQRERIGGERQEAARY